MPLDIPLRLRAEFATVVAIWDSRGTTRRVDSLLLSWVKYEKQLRRLFSYLVFQHPKISGDAIDQAVHAMADHNKLYPETFVKGIAKLGICTIPKLVGKPHAELVTEIARIKKYRNKLMHGQITGQRVSSPQIEKDVRLLVRWVGVLGDAAHAELGYDGIARNTYSRAQTTSHLNTAGYPFGSASEFKEWINRL